MKLCRSGWSRVLCAFLALVLVSLYRQFSLRFWPGDPVRPYVVFAVYLALLLGWEQSLLRRITQRNMRIFLSAEVALLLGWMTVRFIQDAFLAGSPQLLRATGYLIFVPAVTVPLVGLYAAFGLGRGDDYRFSPLWYLLTPPAAGLIFLALTDERRHFLFRAMAGENQPNLYFHPNIGIGLIYFWALALLAARTAVLHRRNRPVPHQPFAQRLAPFAEFIFLVLFCVPYTIASFAPHPVFELVEFSAGVVYIEASAWELFILIGLIPVNTRYRTVFECSSAAMQIVSADGEPIVRSEGAPVLDGAVFARLRRTPVVSLPDGRELQAYRLHGRYLVWQKDASRLHGLIENLRKSRKELEQENALLSQELRLRSEKARVHEESRIYDQLSGEVGPQLALLKKLLSQQDAAGDRAALFGQICLVGTYIKRRCGLRLTEQSEGSLAPEDVNRAFCELADCLALLGVRAELTQPAESLPSAGFALSALDVFEFLLEFEQFSLGAARAAFEAGLFWAEIESERAGRGRLPDAEPALRDAGGCRAVCERRPGGYRVTLQVGGGASCPDIPCRS